MTNYGIKVVEEGADIETNDIREILLSSKYSMLKYYSSNISEVELSPGDTEVYVDFNHTLGYVPAYISYYFFEGKFYFINLPRSADFNSYAYSYADSSKIRCGLAFSTAYNKIIKTASGSTNYYDDHWGVNNFILTGKKDGNVRHGAIRFPGVTVPKDATIVSASIEFAVEYRNGGTGDMKIKTYGIDEDNTADFSSSPMGRDETTSVTTQNVSVPSAGNYFGINVRDQVAEITTRSGWSSGNSLGFKIFDNGSPDSVWTEDDQPTGINSRLEIIYGDSTTITFRTIIFKDKIA